MTIVEEVGKGEWAVLNFRRKMLYQSSRAKIYRNCGKTWKEGNNDPGETQPSASKCEHEWKETQRKTKEEAQADNHSNVDKLQNKPSRAEGKRGYEFENKAIKENENKLDIQAASVEYKCEKCGHTQEVDILGRDQLVEAKSRKFKQIKNRGKQAERLKDIQKKVVNSDKKPLAKLDGNMGDVADSASKYQDRGFEVEILT